MPELLHPGVYVFEAPSTVKPIAGVSTSTAAFIGIADKGPIPASHTGSKQPDGSVAQPVLVTSFTDYQRQFGGFRLDSYLTYAVQNFFDNGGRRVYIVRVAGSGVATATAGPISMQAVAPGIWSSDLRITIANATGGDAQKFDLTITAPGQNAQQVQLEKYTDLTAGGAQVALSGSKFIHISNNLTQRPGNTAGMALAGSADGAGAAAATVTTGGMQVNAWRPGAWANNLLTVTIADSSPANANQFTLQVKLGGTLVETFPNVTFLPGAGPAPSNYARTVVNGTASTPGSHYIRIPTDFGARPANAADVPLAGGADGANNSAGTTVLVLALSAATPGAWGNTVRVAILPGSDPTASTFKLQVLTPDNTVLESFDGLAATSSAPGAVAPSNYGRTVINSRSQYIDITSDFFTLPPTTTSAVSLAGGLDGSAPTPADFVGLAAEDNTVTGSGLHALDKITDVNLIAIPGQGDADTISKGMEYCKNQRPLRDCFFIGDAGTVDIGTARSDNPTASVQKVSDAVTFATSVALDRSAGDFGAIYFPWVWAADPIGAGRNPRILLPPSGFMAGIYARIDNSRGVFKAPAGTEAGLADALAPLVTVSDTEQDVLNPINVNVIRTVPTSGIVSWGARTIGNDPSWRYIPVRRMAIFLRTSIYYGIQWAVFEPNDEPLWAELRLNIRAFMLTQFRAGAFQGSTPDQAFFVRCDSTTTTQQDIDNGVVNILVGFAPLKPAEFVVLTLSQKVNQPAQ